MIDFLFTTTEETLSYCEEVINCLQTYFNYSQEQSINLINNFWQNEQTFDNDDYRLHECSYYWAVVIHLKTIGKCTERWWKDKSHLASS